MPNPILPATTQIVPRPAAAPWPVLGGLAVAVLVAHALILRTWPARWGQGQEPAAQRVEALTTRSITAPLPPRAAAVDLPSPRPAARATRPLGAKKKPVAPPEPSAPLVVDPAADSGQAAAGNDAPPTPAELDSTPPLPSSAEALPAEGAVADAAALAPDSAAQAISQAAQTPVTAMALAASAQLAYKLTGSAKGLTYHAQGELLWQNSGSSYTARMTVKALFIGSRTLSSTGQISAEGLAPSRFSDKSRSEVAAHFEPDKGRISFSANTPPVPWTAGAQDRISVFFQLGGMLAGNPAGFPPGSAISTLTVGPRDADRWTFVVEGEELLDLPFGETATLKLSRQPRRDHDQKVELWYAPALGYLPVRSRITQANGDFVDQQLSALSRP